MHIGIQATTSGCYLLLLSGCSTLNIPRKTTDIEEVYRCSRADHQDTGRDWLRRALTKISYNTEREIMHIALEIFGRGVTQDLAELLIQWLGDYQQTNHLYDIELNTIIDDLVKQRLDAAEENIHIYLFKNPKSAIGRMIAATLCICRNNIKDAIEEFLTAYAQHPSNTIILYTLGCCYERTGCHEKAIEFYQDCLKFDKDLELPLQRLAALYLREHRLEEVIQQYIIITELSPENLSAAIILGYLYITAGEYDSAVDVFNQVFIMQPDNISLRDEEIERYIDQHGLEEAWEYLEHLSQEHADNPELSVIKGDVLSQLGEPLEAISAYLKAFEFVPNSLDIAFKLTSQYIQVDNHEQAAFIFNRALESNEQMLDAYLGLALCFYSKQDMHNTFATLNSASMLLPTSALLYTQLVTMLLKTYLQCDDAFLDIAGQSNIILEAHRSIMMSSPQHPNLHYQQGLLNYHYFGPQAALLEFLLSHSLNPLERRAFSKSIVCNYALGNNRQALNDLLKLIEFDLQAMDLYYKTAVLYSEKAKFTSSLLNLSQNVDLYKDSAMHISVILQNLGILDRTDSRWQELNNMLTGCLDAS